MSPEPSRPAVEAYLGYLRLSELQDELSLDDYLADQPEALHAEIRGLHGEFERVSALLERLTPLASFSDHIRARYGDSVDPGISLSGDRPAEGGVRPPSGAGGETMARLSREGRGADSRYDRRREIARGGMGRIIEVWDADLRRSLAMKVILGRKKAGAEVSEVDERRLSRFLEEAQITSQLDHPGIVPVHELGIDSDGRVYFTMQLVEGRDLRQIFELARTEREGWTRSRVISVLIRVCEAMAYAHSKGVVHRDLKPGNIMVGRFGETYVMDWGLAKVLGRPEPEYEYAPDEESRVRTDRSDSASDDDGGSYRTIDGDIVGTPAYMSPEQARGRMDLICPQSDVYSLGAMMYELLAGQMPYEPLGDKAPAHVILEAVRNGRPWALAQFDPDLPSELVAICEKAMSRDIEDRYADTMDLAEDLRAYIENRTVAAYETGVLYEARKWVERNRPLAASLLAVLLIGLGSIVVFIRQQQQSLDKLGEEQARTELEAQRAEEAARDARTAEAEAVFERDRAADAKEAAVASAEAARRTSYRALISSATYSLRLNETMQAKSSLEACDADLRGWEWHHLSLTVDEDLEQIAQLDAGIVISSASHESRRLLCVTSQFETVLIETETGETRPLDRLGALMMPTAISAAIDETGRLVAIKSGGYFVRVRNVDTGEELTGISLPPETVVTGLRFMIDGRRLLVSDVEDGQSRVRVHDLFDGSVVTSYDRHARTPRCAEPRPRSSEVASGDDAGEVHVWDSEDGKQRLRLRGQHTGPVRTLVWSPDGTLLASGGEDGMIVIWDAETGNLQTIMRGHEGAVTALVFGRSDRRLYSGGQDATLRVWDSRNGGELGSLSGHEAAISGLSLSESGSDLYSTAQDGSVRRWDPAWRPGRLDIPLRGWDLDWNLTDNGKLTDLDFSTDGRRISGIRSRGGSATYDAITGRPLELRDELSLTGDLSMRVYEGGFFSSRHALAGCRLNDGSVRLFSTLTGEVLRDLPPGERPATVVRLSPEGDVVAVGTRGGALRLFDVQSGEQLLRVQAHDRKQIPHLAFSPDGSRVATATRRNVAVWDVATGTALGTWENAHAVGINAVRIAPDGERVATGSNDGTVKFWRPGEAAPVGVLEGHEGAVMDFCFAGDEARRVITASTDGSVRTWDTDSYQILTVMRVSGESFGSVAIDPGKRRIAACGERGLLYVWDSTPAVSRHRLWLAAEREAGEADLILDELEFRLRWSDEIRAALEEGNGLSDALQRTAARRFELRDRDPQMLQRRLREILCRGPLNDADMPRAVALSERILELTRGNLTSRRLHGATLVRVGRAREGLALLGGATGVGAAGDFTRRFLIPRTEDDVMRAYFRSLGQFEIGETGRARELMQSADQSYEFLPQRSQARLALLRQEVRLAVGV